MDNWDPIMRVNGGTRLALELLLRSHEYAEHLSRSCWDFAVEMETLQGLGLHVSDLRWLSCQGLVEHANEITQPRQNQRTFEASGMLNLTKRSCFVLTPDGVQSAREVLSQNPQTGLEPLMGSTNCGPTVTPRTLSVPRESRLEGCPPAEATELTPTWDPDRRELCLGEELVKQFRLPSPNQQYVLTSFEEEGWPVRIDDPLPPSPDSHPKQRLRETIRSLNRHQRSVYRVHFKGDGTGEGVLWEILASCGQRCGG